MKNGCFIYIYDISRLRVNRGILAPLYYINLCNYLFIYFLLCRCDPTRVMASSFLKFLDHTQGRTTVGRTPLSEWSARRRDLYLTTHNIHNRQTSMPPVGFEPTISAGERPQTYALDHAATGTATIYVIMKTHNSMNNSNFLLIYTTFRSDVYSGGFLPSFSLLCGCFRPEVD